MAVTIFHNPRCSKSRQTLALLEETGVTPEIILYLETPPTPATLGTLQRELGFGSIREMMRVKEAVYRELGLSDEGSEDALAEAMSANPILIERPIVTKDGRAVIGRPPENVLDLLEMR